MDNKEMDFASATHLKFSTFKSLSEQLGPEEAWDKMVSDFTLQEKQRLGPFLTEPTLARGFTISIPFFKRIGMEMVVVDISNGGTDAVLEIQKVCPYLLICKEHGFPTPCHAICEMHVEAIRRAFPEMKGDIVSRLAFGDCVCVFKYERPARK